MNSLWLAGFVMLCLGALVAPGASAVEAGILRHAGFLEYQYRVNDGPDIPSSTLQLATWRTDVSAYLWRPWILKVDSALGLTDTVSSTADATRDGALLTGAAAVHIFPRSHFPFRAFYEARDSRVDSELEGFETRTETYGFAQQYSPRGGGRFALEYRRNDTDDIFEDGTVQKRNFRSDNWQFNAFKSLGRNDFRLLTRVREVNRDASAEMENRTTLNLRHRFRTSPRFFVEDTTFYSDERIELDGTDLERRFLQFNGFSTWRPRTNNPLLITGRGLMQAIESGPRGDTRRASSMIATAGANYQVSRNLTLAANAGVTVSSPEEGLEATTVFQRARSTYRSSAIDLGRNQYRFGGSFEVGHESSDDESEPTDDRLRNLAASLNHGISRSANLANGKQLQVNASQQLTAATDSGDRNEYSLVHSVFATLSRRAGRTATYFRLTASDRRLSGDFDDQFQLVNMQASARSQLNRNRAWNGSLTLQYSRSSRPGAQFIASENESLSYSAYLRFTQRALFGMQRLNFSSELRWLSSDFYSDDPFDRRLDLDQDREDRIWRNRLDYRIGRLEFRLHADVREIDDELTNLLFLQVRRYYGGH